MAATVASEEPALMAALPAGAPSGSSRVFDVDEAPNSPDVQPARKGAPPRGASSATAKAVAEFDFDGDGVVSKEDLKFARKQREMEHGFQQYQRKLIIALIVAIGVLAGAMFGLSFAAVEMAKEMHLSDDGVVQSSSGKTVLVGSADMVVVDGVLYSRVPPDEQQGAGVRCDEATGRCGGAQQQHALATRPAEERRALSSKIADEIFQNLDRVSFEIPERTGLSMNVTMRVLGFMRTRSYTNDCGTVVRLDVQHGTIIIDGEELHFDRSLTEHFEAQGLFVWSEAHSAFGGRRLDSRRTLALGLFSFFEDFECQNCCFNFTKPRSPRMPYKATLLEKRPCLGENWCKSRIFEGFHLPGYDESTDSILTVMTVIASEDLTITVQTLPNHPGQDLVTVTDHADKTTRHYQLAAQEFVTQCYNDSYTPHRILGAEDWHYTYMGDARREAEVYEVLGETFSTSGGTRRLFQLQPRNSSDPLQQPVDYEDDPDNLLPKRLFLHTARSEGWDIEEVLTIDMQELDDAAAHSIFADYEAKLVCGAPSLSFPKMSRGAFHESMSAVRFYVQDLRVNDPASPIPDPYWNFAQEFFAPEDQDSSTPAPEANSSNVSSPPGGRRLGFGALARTFSWLAQLAKKGAQQDSLSLTIEYEPPNLVCGGLAVEITPALRTGWWGSGDLTLGNNCGSREGDFSVKGGVTIGYNWSTGELQVLNFKVGCSVSVWGSIHGSYEQYSYDCGRRLGEEVAASEEHELEAQDDEVLEDLDADLDDPTVPAALDAEDEMESPHYNEYDEQGMTEEERRLQEGRRLGWLHRRRRRRRRASCSAPGVAVQASIGVEGFCEAGRVAVGVSGSLDLTLGPFPEDPFDSRFTGEIKASGCVEILFVSGCIVIGGFDLFDIDLKT
mmetsp:Transcript_36767/g.86187  ORF Transcript_36767/g.86187 Transcript_36767/m.86187 type:complete len:897 (+) Transcript_36767:124-2814(+)